MPYTTNTTQRKKLSTAKIEINQAKYVLHQQSTQNPKVFKIEINLKVFSGRKPNLAINPYSRLSPPVWLLQQPV